MQNPDCVFCMIVNGSISARLISQNTKAIAVLDAFPLAAGHALVITKSHHPKVQDLETMEAASLFEMARRVSAAVEEAMRVTATTIAIHNGREAGQEIPHVHVHIIPRTASDGAGPVHSMFTKRPKLDDDEMEGLRKEIAARLA